MRTKAIAILVLASAVVACRDDQSTVKAAPPTAAPPPSAQPLSVRVDGPTRLTPPAEAQFTALQTWSDGSIRDVTSMAQWTSSNPSVLSVHAGLAKALAGGEVGLTARVEPLTSQSWAVQVVPVTPEWEGTYRLLIGVGPCNTSLPLPSELNQRSYTATIRQSGLNLFASISNVAEFGGRILNPEVRFSISNAAVPARRVHKVAYWGPPPGFTERIEGYRLVISGNAVTTMSSGGFAGTLDGQLALYEANSSALVGVCASSSHGFKLARQ